MAELPNRTAQFKIICPCLALVFLPLVSAMLTQTGEPLAIRISCGSSHNSPVTRQNYLWLKDFGFTSGNSAPVDTKISGVPELSTLRYFQTSDGPENCYNITVPIGHYLIRFLFAYGDVDNFNREPQFDVSLEGTLVHSLKPGWSAEFDMSYADSLAFISDGAATACFHSSGHGNPSVVSLEILQIHNLAYRIPVYSNDYTILKTIKRISCSAIFSGYGADFNADPWGGNRHWATDNGLTQGTRSQLRTSNSIQSCCGAPNFYPEVIYQSASTTGVGASLFYTFDIEPNQNYSIWLHFAEISDAITSKEQRVFDVLVNDRLLFTDVDIISQAGGPFIALILNKTVLVEGRTLNLTFRPVQRGILVNAIEVYQVIRMEFVTTISEVWSLQALKYSLGLPPRVGWNGDPCVPQEHPWNCLDCSLDVKKGAWFIVGLDLHGQGLKGQLNGAISLLSQIQSINMSSNNIHGAIPVELGNLSYLFILDLSFNNLNGSIPDSIGKLKHIQKLYLNGNWLSGKIPNSLLGGPIRGASFNFSENQGLCGIPGLPSCGFSLTLAPIVGIVFGTITVAVLLLACCLCLWRRRSNIIRAKRSLRDAPFAKSRTTFKKKDLQLTRTSVGSQLRGSSFENSPPLLY